MSAFSLRRPVFFVTGLDDCWPHVHSSEYLHCIVYEQGKEESVVSLLNDCRGLYDALIFIGNRFDGLLKMIDNATDIFHSGVVSLVDQKQPVNISLRLDTNVLQYRRLSNNEYSIAEQYGIKAGTMTVEQTLERGNVKPASP